MQTLITLFIGTLGGIAAYYLGLPIPWLIGSLLIVVLLKKNSLVTPPPKIFSQWVRIFLGVALGSSLSSTVGSIGPSSTVTIYASILFVLAVTFFGCIYFRRLKNFTPLDSFMSALPGGLTFLVSLSDNLGDRFPKIALIHTVRMVALLFLFSLFAYFLESSETPEEQSIISAFAFTYDVKLWALLAVTLLSGLFAKSIKIAGGDIMFPMIISAIFYNIGLIEIPMPEIIKTVAMITFGVVIGCKISSCNLAESRKQVQASLVFTAMIISIAFAIAYGLGVTFDKHYFLFFLALAPGSIPEICLIAIALGFDVGFVALIHTCRYLFIMLIGAIGFHALSFFEKRSAPKEELSV